MAKSLETWKKQVYNKPIDLDNQSFDCVDVSKSWIVYLSDKGWQTSAGWGNAKDIWYNWSGTYLERVPRGNAPKLGDIVCMDGAIGGGYGHTGVVVAINGSNITIYQQNSFTQQPVYTGVYNAYVSYIQGFLRPKIAFETGAAPALQGFQRVVGPDGVHYRTQPNTSAPDMQPVFKGGEVLDFKGFVRGQSVDGNNIWFVGRYTGGYSWSGGFTDPSTHDLPDLTPATTPALQGFQRQVGNSVVNYRREPKVMPDNVIQTFNPGDVLDFKAWTHGALVDGTDVWFQGKYTGGWVHAGGLTDQTTHDLPEVKLEVTPVPVDPVYPEPTRDPEVTKVFNKKHPIGADYVPKDLVNVGGGQQLRKEAADSLALMQQQTGTLVPASGYRSYETQKTLYENYVKQDGQAEADRYSARPGHSEHQTGLTMDFGPVTDNFKNSPAYTWLTANAHKYGWVLRYPADKESVTGYMSEPWHWRYIGVAAAKDMNSKGVTTLEEYYNIEGGLYPDQEPKPTDPTEPDPVYDVNFIVKFFNALVAFIKGFFSKNK